MKKHASLIDSLYYISIWEVINIYFLLNNLFNEYLSTFTSFPIFFLFQILTISLIKIFPPFYRFSILISPIQGGNN